MMSKAVSLISAAVVLAFLLYAPVSQGQEEYEFVSVWPEGVSLYGPAGIALDSSGNVYTAEYDATRIQSFTSDGAILRKWGSYGDHIGQFYGPVGIAVDYTGRVFVADPERSCVQRFTLSGDGITAMRWGIDWEIPWSDKKSSDDGQLMSPIGIAVDRIGYVYVADAGNSRIQKFTSNGDFVKKWGTRGSGDGQFGRPWGVAVDIAGYVYVTDPDNNRVQKFTSDGIFVKKWGTSGSGNGQFKFPSGVAVDNSGSVYICDSENYRMQKFTSDAVFQLKWGTKGSGDGQLNVADAVAVDGAGNVYVADGGNDRVQKFDSEGRFINKWGASVYLDGRFWCPQRLAADGSGNVYVADTYNDRIQKLTPDGVPLKKWGQYGTQNGQFKEPNGIAVSDTSGVFVTDRLNFRVQRFTRDGMFVGKWGTEFPYMDILMGKEPGGGQFAFIADVAVDGSGNVYVLDSFSDSGIQKFTPSGVFLKKWGKYGSGDGEFRTPCGIAADDSGNIYVADTFNNRIQKFTSDGVFLKKWGTEGSGNGQFKEPSDIAVDSSGNIYVADTGNNRIQKLSPDGVFLAKWGTFGYGNEQFYGPSGVAVDISGNVYVADAGNDRIQKFSPVVRPPVLSDIPDQTIEEGGTFAAINLDEFVSDPDNADSEMTWTYTGNTKLTVTIDDSRVATVTVSEPEWGGSETITFTATDPDGLSASDSATFTVSPVNDPPVVSDIPDQTIEEGGTFAAINLDEFVSDPDNADSEMTWTYTGNTKLTVTIDGSRVATVTVSEPEWNGSETITFTATDTSGLSASDSATFTVSPKLVLPGDVNRDGQVRANDAILALRIASGLLEPDDYQKRAADINGDGQVKANDAIIILRIASGVAAPGKRIAANTGRTITVKLPDAHGVAGDNIILPLTVDSIAGLAGGDICIAYDSAVLRAIEVSSDEDTLLVSNIVEPGLVRIAFASPDGFSSKALARLEFHVITDDLSPLKLQTVEIYGFDATPISLRKLDGRFASWAIPPKHSALLQNFPNPFNPETWIPYQLKEGSEVIIRIFNLKGELIREFELGFISAGLYVSRDRALHWDGKNRYGEDVASGVYFYSIQAGNFAAVRKFTVLR